jgi:hypothetical protein
MVSSFHLSDNIKVDVDVDALLEKLSKAKNKLFKLNLI